MREEDIYLIRRRESGGRKGGVLIIVYVELVQVNLS